MAILTVNDFTHGSFYHCLLTLKIKSSLLSAPCKRTQFEFAPDLQSTKMVSLMGCNEEMKRERLIFNKAGQFLKPGPFFRLVTYLYAERKMVVFFLIHLTCTLIVWGKRLKELRFQSLYLISLLTFSRPSDRPFCFDQVARARREGP